MSNVPGRNTIKPTNLLQRCLEKRIISPFIPEKRRKTFQRNVTLTVVYFFLELKYKVTLLKQTGLTKHKHVQYNIINVNAINTTF